MMLSGSSSSTKAALFGGLLMLLAAGREVSAQADQIRCFVCPGEGNLVESLTEAPAYADRCAQVLLELPAMCTDLLSEDRLQQLKDQRMEAVSLLEKSGNKIASYRKKAEVATLWNALRKVRERETEKMWGELQEAMDSESQDLIAHGLPQEAGRLEAASEVVKAGRKSSLRGVRAAQAAAVEEASSSSKLSLPIRLSEAEPLTPWGSSEQQASSISLMEVRTKESPPPTPPKLLNLPADPLYQAF